MIAQLCRHAMNEFIASAYCQYFALIALKRFVYYDTYGRGRCHEKKKTTHTHAIELKWTNKSHTRIKRYRSMCVFHTGLCIRHPMFEICIQVNKGWLESNGWFSHSQLNQWWIANKSADKKRHRIAVRHMITLWMIWRWWRSPISQEHPVAWCSLCSVRMFVHHTKQNACNVWPVYGNRM